MLKCGPTPMRGLAAVVIAMMLASCGGSGGGGGGSGSEAPQPQTPAPPPVAAPTSSEAARFLTQATFGPNEASINALRGSTYAAWVSEQLAMPVSGSHLAYMDARLAEFRVTNANATVRDEQFFGSFWAQAATGPDQLRQRVKLALSEIFVISMQDRAVDPRGAASYYDVLGENAFGNYRTLLEKVTLHPMMGVYLTYLANQKEDPNTGRTPDENYAREVLQLMSIGTAQLNPDGTVRTGGNGAPLPAYTAEDVSGLAKVFTGFSWYSPTPSRSTYFGQNRDPTAVTRSMIVYPEYHSASSKSFLGATTSASAEADLTVALDTIANHPNTGPFISRQLIQRLVTSNPTPAYVGRVAAVFGNNGAGVRGDLGAVVRAILLDPEARDPGLASGPTSGKLREPVIRLTNWIRAFNVPSASGAYLIPTTSGPSALNQSVLSAPSVFNFWRPGYSPPNTRLGGKGLVAPEFQVVDEVSVAGYLNFMQTVVDRGIGNGGDVRTTYPAEQALATDPAALVERMNLLLVGGRMSDLLKLRLTNAVASVPMPADAANQAGIDAAKLDRARIAIFLTMASPEYLAQP